MSQVYPVLMCGGSGTRLWPLSRRSYPKQFASLVGSESLFQASARRLSGALFHRPLVLTGAEFRFIVTEQLAGAGLDPKAVLIEPAPRNTAPAVLAAALWLQRTAGDVAMLVAPSDHVIPDTAGFRAAVVAGLPTAQAGQIVTFGIRPTRAETGYGYLELTSPDTDGTIVPLRRFVEKPDAASAVRMVAGGQHLWNAGIFLFTTQTIIAAFRTHAPELIPAAEAAVTGAREDLNFIRLGDADWHNLPDLSLDYAVMEKAANLSVVPYHGAWSDLGDWEAVRQHGSPSDNGLATTGPVTAIDCADSLLRSESEDVQLVGIGLRDIVAVAMKDAVLVADRNRTQEVRLAVDALRKAEAAQASDFPVDRRPWGQFERLAEGRRFQVKRIEVAPGRALSLQSHHHRAEHWIVVEGTAKVTIGDDVRLVTENQSVYIPIGTVHRLENPGKLPMVLIEVQTGAYLGEDDIVRYQDDYARD
jgi:mannose-1-phosphate guanylyltransferase / mannose-6-phosphate isomerase